MKNSQEIVELQRKISGAYKKAEKIVEEIEKIAESDTKTKYMKVDDVTGIDDHVLDVLAENGYVVVPTRATTDLADPVLSYTIHWR